MLHWGKRACPRVRATIHGISPWEKASRMVNSKYYGMIIVETVEGFNNLEEIVKTPGIRRGFIWGL